MVQPVSPREKKRRIDAFEASKTATHPNGSMRIAADKLGDISPNALSQWLNQHGVKTVNEPLFSKQECIDALKSYIARHKSVPSRDSFIAHGGIGVRWKTHWPIWADFLQVAGVIGDDTKILLLDIETAPNRAYFWGGTYKQNINPDWIDAAGYVLCWTAKWLGKKEVVFRRLRNGNHKALLSPMHKLLSEAHAVVHYNGKKFDIPTLNKEFLIRGMKPPSPYKQIDLLKTMWETFLFPSNKLDYICKALDIGQKLRHEGPQLWMDCMDNKSEAWKKMEAYNRRDVELLEQLYRRLLPWIKGHPNRGAANNDQICPSCGSFDYVIDGEHRAQVLKYRRYQCADCGTWFRSNRSSSPRLRAGEERFVAAI
jgi:hypothetical protein